MFAVTTTPTSLSSSATRSLKNTKASSLSKRAKCSSIVVSSSSSSSSSGKNKLDEKFDRREMLKNALVASIGVVAATPMPVRSFVRLVLPMISRVFMCFVVFRLDHQKAEKETRRESAFVGLISHFSLLSHALER
jgi:Na+/pantothenate symporter